MKISYCKLVYAYAKQNAMGYKEAIKDKNLKALYDGLKRAKSMREARVLCKGLITEEIEWQTIRMND